MFQLHNFLARSPKTPARAAEIGDYLVNMHVAGRLMRRLGYPVELPTSWRTSSFVRGDYRWVVRSLKAAGVKDLRRGALLCLRYARYMQPFVEQELGMPVWVTVGQIWYRDRAILEPTWEGARRWVSEGIQQRDFTAGGGLNLHAWLTLASGEILELTFPSSMALANPGRHGNLAGLALCDQEDKVLDEHRYFPMIVGNDAIDAMSRMSVLPLTAGSASELNFMPYLVVRE